MFNNFVSDDLRQRFEGLYMGFRNCLMAMQFQNLGNAEQINIWARNFYGSFAGMLQPNEAVPFRIVVSLISIATHITRSNDYEYEERFKKSMEELQAARKDGEEVAVLFTQVPNAFTMQLGFDKYLPFFRFMANFHERIVTARIGLTQGSINRANGKFIDELLLLRTAAAEMHRLQEKQFGPFGNPQDDNYALEMIGLMNKYAAYYEKRAERLEERQKDTTYMDPIDRKVFIVHGHNVPIAQALKKMLADSFGLQPIILFDETDEGLTVIEKFEHYGRLCAFAFVVVTPDDLVEKNGEQYFQARPNVLFELGWFCGRYGRDKVRILLQRRTPLPSDLNGIIAIDFEDNIQDVFPKIRADLERAGIIDVGS